MTERDKWFSDPSNARELEVLLNHPVLKQAIDILIKDKLPHGFTVGDASLQVTQAAHNWHFFAGFHDFHRGLAMLTAQKKEAQETMEAWDPAWSAEFLEKKKMEQTKSV